MLSKECGCPDFSPSGDHGVAAVSIGRRGPSRLQSVVPPPGNRRSGANGYVLGRIATDVRGIQVVAVSLLVLTAGCGAIPGGEDDSSTVAPQLAGTAGHDMTTSASLNASRPPGVAPESADQVDERELYLAHERALDGRSVTWRRQRLWTNTTGSVVAWRTSTSWRDGSDQRFESAAGGRDSAVAPVAPAGFDYWTNGSVFLTRQTSPDGSVQYVISDEGPPSRIANIGAGRTTLESVLTGVELRYVGVDRDDGGAAIHVLTATPDDGQLTLRVTPRGVVRSFVLTSPAEVNGEALTVVRRFRTYDVGATTVERPAWVHNATD